MIQYFIYTIIAVLIGTNLYFRSKIFKLSRTLGDKGIRMALNSIFNDKRMRDQLNDIEAADRDTALELVQTMRQSFMLLGAIVLCLLLLYFFR